jgi:hypothetical protein
MLALVCYDDGSALARIGSEATTLYTPALRELRRAIDWCISHADD